MTHQITIRRQSRIALTLLALGSVLISTLTGRAQTTTATNTVVTTVVTTTATATNTASSTNVTTTVTVTPAPVRWDTTFTFGLTVTGGNTKTLLTSVDLESQRKSPLNEILLDVNGTYGENNNVKNAEQLDGSGQYNRLATDRLYYGIKEDGFHDGIAGIDYRITSTPLAGYYLLKAPKTELGVEIGPGYVYQRNLGSDTTLSHATLRLGERFQHSFSGGTKIWEKMEILPEVNNFGNYYADGEIGISATLSKHTALTSYVDDSYYSVPALGLLHNDVKLVTGLTYKF
jgi:putative salt-induced outer membrane protein YdiY